MCKPCFVVVSFILALLAAMPGPVAAQEAGPDLKLAFILSAASFCAYTVITNAANPDELKMARKCLKAAATTSPLLGELNIGDDDVEAYVSLDGIGAYLLVKMKNEKGLILAFRGTLPPPDYHGPVDYTAPFILFVNDWINDANIAENAMGRHNGINRSWQNLLAHLKADCGKGDKDGQGRCSRFEEFSTRAGLDAPLFVTGHSKGGALATLATLDIKSGALGSGRTIAATYTVSAPKSFNRDMLVSAAGADIVDKTRDIWRFEYEVDIVPLLPLDNSIMKLLGYDTIASLYSIINNAVRSLLPDYVLAKIPQSLASDIYAPVGKLAFIDSIRSLKFHPGGGAGEVPADIARLDEYLQELKKFELILSLFDLKSEVLGHLCRVAVENHFRVLADIGNLEAARVAGKQGPSPPYRVEQTERTGSFFSDGLRDGSGTEVMWGFREKCPS